MLKAVKHTFRLALPGVFYYFKRIRSAREFRYAHGGAEYRAKQILASQYGVKILAGPFAGMVYGHDVNCGAYVAKLVGSYEEELHGVIGEIRSRGYFRIIDVGAAEGYYAVGLARVLPEAEVLAYDTDLHSQRYCQDLARLNHVQDRVKVRGICDCDELQGIVGPNVLLISDCEGFEMELLNPARVPQIACCDILVEIHEALRPGVTAAILDRFSKSHYIVLIDARDRDPSHYPQLSGIAEEDRPWAVREGRPWPMQWAWMTSKSTTQAGTVQK